MPGGFFGIILERHGESDTAVKEIGIIAKTPCRNQIVSLIR
jgi:hypothetical protein